jgi:hypothetical protein
MMLGGKKEVFYMKRIFCVLLGVSMVFVFVGCGKTEVPSTPNTEKPSNAVASPESVAYYCMISEPGPDGLVFYPLANTNAEKFDQLAAFYECNAYDSENPVANVIPRQLPANAQVWPEYRFFKESDAEVSRTNEAQFFVWENHLVLSWGYAQDGTGANMVMDVPEELSAYFIALAQEAATQENGISTGPWYATQLARQTVVGSAYSRQSVIITLINQNVSEEDAIYGVDHCGVDWMAQAVKCLKKYWISDPGYRDELINTLKAEKFTEEEAAYAVNYAMKLSAEPKNFVYSCLIDKHDGKGLIRYTVPNIDVKKFEQLLEFCAANSYDPLGSNAGKQTRRLPYGVVKEPEIRFGRESENRFTSEGAGRFYVWEGKLVLLWYTSGDDYTLVADVPDSLGQYFVNLIDTLKSEG